LRGSGTAGNERLSQATLTSLQSVSGSGVDSTILFAVGAVLLAAIGALGFRALSRRG
jgi:hypothetical protein